jgi:class 3 adenylate cyclase
MSIQRRINLSFLVIAVLFAVNVGIYIWNNGRARGSADSLRRSIRRELLFADVREEITVYQKQMEVMSQSFAGASAPASPADIAQLEQRLRTTSSEAHEIEQLADPGMRADFTAFAKSFDELSASWLVFYRNVGVNPSLAIKELAIRSEPLSQKVIEEMLPRVLAEDRARVNTATQSYFSDNAFSQRVNLTIFGLSTVIAMLVGGLVLRYLVRGLNKLKEGAEQVGHRRLDFRIEMKTNDELGKLASAFNEMAGNLSAAKEELDRRHEELEAEKRHAETLLLNILPSRAAKELREKGSVDPRYFEDVTIMFTDFVGFTLSTETLAAEDLVHMLHDYFTAFDNISRRYGLEKLKTIGDSYMCISGLPVRNPSHPVDVVMAAFEMVQAVAERSRNAANVSWKVRVGIHTGPVVAGVVGIDKFAFDIWGDSVNFSSRMESSGSANRINISERTHGRIKDFFECEYRGKIQTKDKREVDMYFVNGVLPGLLDETGAVPPAAFARRYKTYFEKDPPAFPAILASPRLIQSA